MTQYDQPLLDRCAALGAEILENAAAMLAPGGILVYSTCTFAPGKMKGRSQLSWQGIRSLPCVIFPAAVLASPVKPTGQGTIRYRQNTAAASGPVMAARAILWPNCKRRRMPRRWNCRAAKTVKEKAAKHPVWMPRHCRRGRALPKSFSHIGGPAHCSSGGRLLLEPPALLPAAKLHVLRAGVPAGRAAKGALNRPTRCLWLTVPSAPIARS